SLPAGAFDFDHDGTGNRLSRTVDSSDVTGYNYATGTNRLSQSTGSVAASYGYDASGNIATDSTDTTAYNLTDDQRLASVTKGGVTAGAYQYDGRGLRTVKIVNGEDTLFVSCKSGKLIAESDSDGNILKEYIYLEGDIFAHFQYEVPAVAPEGTVAVSELPAEEAAEPVLADNPPVVVEASTPSDTAFLQPIFFLLLLQNKSAEGAYYYINDHLGAPQIITDDSGSIVWQAEYLPFGKVNISVAQIENNLRFPGQYFDAETGLHYNWNRYYDPETGRYIAADPIGLDGGMNLYAYVGSDPVNGIDPEGLICGTGVCVGTSILVVGAIIASQGDLEIPSSSPALPADRILPVDRPWRKRSRWHVYVRCHGVKFGDCTDCPKFIGGQAYGGTFPDAFARAQMDANGNLGFHGFRQCRARHCQPVACFENGQRKPCPKSGR
ncbi:MAG: RHS repeat-associated core domain-containing protein, partial [Candidatus Electrothrix sp. Rat3]|nr:RHS repeat-associated core domain-containing protein [Candidatus Electrothrix rattekaaiensis]